MNIAFFIGMVLLFIVLTAISVALFKYSRRGWLIWGGILLVGFFLLRRPVSDLVDPWFLSSVEVSVSEVISAREFTVQGWAHTQRHIVLAGTRLPNTTTKQDAAKAELLKLLGEKKRVTISFPQTVRRMPEPWSAIVISGDVSVNEKMLMSGFLPSDGTTVARTPALAMVESKGDLAEKDALSNRSAAPEHSREATEPLTTSDRAPKETAAGVDAEKQSQSGKYAKPGEVPPLPTGARYVIWVLAGFFGATSLGMVLNKRYIGLAFLLLIAGLAVRSIVLSHQSGATIVPPIVCLIVIVVFAGGGRMANKEFLESQSSSRK